MNPTTEIKSLSDDQLNRALAEALGVKIGYPCNCGNPLHYRNSKGALRKIPNYAGDLNACHAVVASFTDDQLYDYRTELCKSFYQGEKTAHKSMQKAIDATARQRAEALLATIQAPNPTN